MSIALLLGTLIGITLGLTGAGGGILAVPALVVGLNFPMTQATPIALIAVGAAALIGALAGLRQGIVRYKAALLMAVVGSAASPAGRWIALQLSGEVLTVVFSAVMILVAYRMYCQARASSDEASDDLIPKNCQLSQVTGKFVWNLRTAITLSVIGLVSGLFTGMLGVGGGFVIVPALRHYSNASIHTIVATSLMVIALISATTVVGALSNGVDIGSLGLAFVGAVMAGMLVGRVASPHVPAKRLQQGFAAISVLVAALLLAKTFLAS